MPIRLANAAIWSDLRKRLEGGLGPALAKLRRLRRVGPPIQARLGHSSAGVTSCEQGTASVVVLIVLPQDLDLLLPTIDRFEALDHVQSVTVVAAELAHSSPRVVTKLQAAGIRPRLVDSDAISSGAILGPRVGAILTASETSLRPHAQLHSLAQIANERGIRTYTLQHGHENVGLTYFDDEHGRDVRFASQVIFTWNDPRTLPNDVPEETLRRCVGVGCPKAVPSLSDVPDFPLARSRFVAIFENLHWKRYPDDYVRGFLSSVEALCDAFPGISFVVKPHHAGRWLTHRFQGNKPSASNLIIADPTDPVWEPHTAASFIAHAQAVITSPSTVALDAARARCPTAVFAGRMKLPLYGPLPLLRSAPDAIRFVSQSDPHTHSETLEKFLEAWLLPGDAVARITQRIQLDLRCQALNSSLQGRDFHFNRA